MNSLTLQPAFDERDQVKQIEQIAHQAPVPLRRHDRRIPRDLETLVLKALAKDPRGRFSSAAELGDELRRYLESRPINSRPVTVLERSWRWCKRSPGLAAACIGTALLTLILLVGSIIVAGVVYHQRNQIRERLFESLTSEARATRFSRQVGQRFKSLDSLAQAAEIARDLKLPPDRVDLIRDNVIACLALPDLKPTGHVIHRPPGMRMAVFDPTMRRYALRFRDGTILIKNVDDDREVGRFHVGGDSDVFVFSFSPDGRYLATSDFPEPAVIVWDVDQKAIAVTDPGPIIRFSPDSTLFAAARDTGEIVIHDLRRKAPRRDLAGPGAHGRPRLSARRPSARRDKSRFETADVPDR